MAGAPNRQPCVSGGARQALVHQSWHSLCRRQPERCGWYGPNGARYAFFQSGANPANSTRWCRPCLKTLIARTAPDPAFSDTSASPCPFTEQWPVQHTDWRLICVHAKSVPMISAPILLISIRQACSLRRGSVRRQLKIKKTARGG